MTWLILSLVLAGVPVLAFFLGVAAGEARMVKQQLAQRDAVLRTYCGLAEANHSAAKVLLAACAAARTTRTREEAEARLVEGINQGTRILGEALDVYRATARPPEAR